MLLTAARWAHLSCSTYPLLLTPLTTGSWPTFSIGASIFGAMRWPGLSPTSTTEPRWSPSAATHHWHPRYRPKKTLSNVLSVQNSLWCFPRPVHGTSWEPPRPPQPKIWGGRDPLVFQD